MTSTLLTLCDLIRYGTTTFSEAVLTYGHGTDNAFDEACFMVLETLHLPPEHLEAFWHAKVTDAERTRILELFEQRVTARTPAPYLVGRAKCQGYSFFCDPRAIIPRSFIAEILCGPDTPVPDAEEVSRVLDLCTGGGSLAIIAADLFPLAKVDAVDLSPDALALAKKNVESYGFEDRLTLYNGDLFAPLPKNARYDLILTNPPYVDAPGMANLPPEYGAEPKMALDGGDDGLDLVHKILRAAPDYLKPEGMMICELGRCGPALQAAYPDMAFSWLNTENSQGEVFFLTREELLALKELAA